MASPETFVQYTPNPPNPTKNPQSVNYDVGQRIQALALAEYGVDPKVAAEAAGIKGGALAVRRLQQKARKRGYDPAVSKVFKVEYVIDAPRSGRPRNDGGEVRVGEGLGGSG